MKPVAFDYARVGDIEAATRLLARDDIAVKIVAGSQSLGPMLNLRLVQPDLLVDITGIEELRRFEEGPEGITLGACITHADIEDRRVPDVTFGALPSVAAGIAYRAVRNRGTIGGSLSHADPSADWISILTALGAQVALQGAHGRRSLPVGKYMVGALEADLRHGEMLVSVHVPRLRAGARWGYHKLCRKTGEFAHAIGACLIDRGRGVARLVVGATESRPLLIEGAEAFALLGEGGRLDHAGVDARLRQAGMSDAVERHIHIVALARAVDRSVSP